MSSQCPVHDEPMVEREGQYGSFWSHKTTDPKYPSGYCNGKPPKASTNSYAYKKFEAAGEQVKRGVGVDPDPAWIKAGDKTEAPMTRKDWNEKEFVKGLAVYSSQARQEGMDPVTAFKTMHIASWLRLAYGDLDGFDEWIASVKERLGNLGD